MSANVTDIINYAAWAETKAIGIRDRVGSGELHDLAHAVVWLADAVKQLGEIERARG
ncbi:hypothetical protein [Miniimonas sp. S16]|uniref:hypothetical protein n=1 Tax=Miniimonas sp. S16 TaxID=2171623 RepID=UPI00131EED54|nr:hypothetical protein [Miniimonas sp. S16]